jgi:hypothetical protein
LGATHGSNESNGSGRCRIAQTGEPHATRLSPTSLNCHDMILGIYGSVSVTAVVLGGLPPGSVSAHPGDSLRIWPRERALHLTCPRVADTGLAHLVGLIRSLSADGVTRHRCAAR